MKLPEAELRDKQAGFREDDENTLLTLSRFLANIIILLLLASSIQAQDSTYIQEAEWLSEVSLSCVDSSLSGTCRQTLAFPIEVRVNDASDHPVPGIQVVFSIIAHPDQGSDASLSHLLVYTDSSGLAHTELTLGSKPGTYRVAGRIEEGFPDNEVIFTAKASRKNWIWILEGMSESIESSKTHLEVLALFSTIDSHATSIARIALDWDQKTK